MLDRKDKFRNQAVPTRFIGVTSQKTLVIHRKSAVRFLSPTQNLPRTACGGEVDRFGVDYAEARQRHVQLGSGCHAGLNG